LSQKSANTVSSTKFISFWIVCVLLQWFNIFCSRSAIKDYQKIWQQTVLKHCAIKYLLSEIHFVKEVWQLTSISADWVSSLFNCDCNSMTFSACKEVQRRKQDYGFFAACCQWMMIKNTNIPLCDCYPLKGLQFLNASLIVL
jgi:hypothetical protein